MARPGAQHWAVISLTGCLYCCVSVGVHCVMILDDPITQSFVHDYSNRASGLVQGQSIRASVVTRSHLHKSTQRSEQQNSFWYLKAWDICIFSSDWYLNSLVLTSFYTVLVAARVELHMLARAYSNLNRVCANLPVFTNYIYSVDSRQQTNPWQCEATLPASA